MRNISAALFVLLAAGALTANAAHAYEEDDEECSYSVSGVDYSDVLNIRAWPASHSRIVGFIPPRGEGVELIRRKGRWGLVSYRDFEGWAHMRYLRRECD